MDRTSSSLDPLQTSVENPGDPPPYSVLRHARHHRRRSLIQSIFATDALVSPSRRARYADCGRGGFVWWDPDERTCRLTCYRCGDLFCPTCAAERKRQVRHRLSDFFQDYNLAKSLKLLTLTLRSSSDPLADQLTTLLRSFRRLRQRVWWKRRARGGCWFVQVTRNADTGLWHPHLHCLLDSDYLERHELSDLWQKVTAGSIVVDIRVIRKADHAANYVARYVSQPVDLSKLPRDAIAETIRAFHGRRLWHPFGDWVAALKSVEDRPSTERWQPLGQADRIIRAAWKGDLAAQAVCRQLRLPCSPPPGAT